MTLKTYDDAAALFSYDPLSGKLYWKVGRSFHIKPGDELARVANGEGYLHVKFNGKTYKQHRIAWLLYYKMWPEFEIDHVNHVRHDNRIENMKAATRLENSRNNGISKKNTSGVTGVCKHKQFNKWRAQIRTDGEQKHLGLFDTFDEAVTARKDAEVRYGYHENHGMSRGEV